MKKQCIIVVLCMGLQSNFSISAERKQTWTEWFKSKFFSKDVPLVPQAALTAGVASLVVGPTSVVVLSAGQVATISLLSSLYAAWIMDLLKKYPNRRAVEELKYILALAVADSLLYPTRQLKIRILLDRGDFLKYVKGDQNDKAILIDACNQLVNELPGVYSDEELRAEEEINNYIKIFEDQITTFSSLEGQIAALERMQEEQMTINKMRAYLSLYYRLKNQLQAEKGLTPEQKKIFGDISLSFGQRVEQQETMKEQELERLNQEKERVLAKPVEEGQ